VSRRNGSPLFPWVTGDGKLHKDPHIQLIIEPVLEPLLPESPHHSNENTFFITRESGDPPIGGAGGGAVNSDINVSNEGNPPTPEALFNEGKLEKPYPNNEVLYSYWKQGYNYGVEGDYINYHWQKWVIGYQGINPSNELRVNLENSGNVIPRIEAISRGYEYGLQYNFNYNQFQAFSNYWNIQFYQIKRDFQNTINLNWFKPSHQW